MGAGLCPAQPLSTPASGKAGFAQAVCEGLGKETLHKNGKSHPALSL